jgi:hypothetical protein
LSREMVRIRTERNRASHTAAANRNESARRNHTGRR